VNGNREAYGLALVLLGVLIIVLILETWR